MKRALERALICLLGQANADHAMRYIRMVTGGTTLPADAMSFRAKTAPTSGCKRKGAEHAEDSAAYTEEEGRFREDVTTGADWVVDQFRLWAVVWSHVAANESEETIGNLTASITRYDILAIGKGSLRFHEARFEIYVDSMASAETKKTGPIGADVLSIWLREQTLAVLDPLWKGLYPTWKASFPAKQFVSAATVSFSKRNHQQLEQDIYSLIADVQRHARAPRNADEPFNPVDGLESLRATCKRLQLGAKEARATPTRVLQKLTAEHVYGSRASDTETRSNYFQSHWTHDMRAQTAAPIDSEMALMDNDDDDV